MSDMEKPYKDLHSLIDGQGSQESWLNIYDFLGQILPVKIEEIIEASAASCFYQYSPNDHSKFMLRLNGTMDAVLEQGVAYMRPFIPRWIPNELISVHLIPKADLLNQAMKDLPLTAGYDVTLTAAAMLDL
jgi:hypothetical protein